MKRFLRWGALVALITLGVGACGGGAGSEQQQPKARPLPDSSQDLRPGEYRTEAFKPALTFTVGKGWTLECPAGDDNVCLLPPGEQTLFKFVNVDEVYKPSGLLDMSGKTTPPPADLVSWLQHHPYLQTDKPEPVTVGGIKGQQIDVVVGDLPTDYSGACGFDCVQLSVLSIGLPSARFPPKSGVVTQVRTHHPRRATWTEAQKYRGPSTSPCSAQCVEGEFPAVHIEDAA